ncbi:MAG: nuclear transport factor 2 family protein [Sphingobacterium sp.]|jgi:ketosteroid isomerase-like protein|nr:nuclear transport factor 2 family protein [Sphingobacterium sp.]
MTKAAILELENRLYTAIKESDLQALDELLHQDLLFMVPGGGVITKEIDLKTYRDGQLQVIELLPQIEDLHIIDDTAVITLTIEMKGNYNGQPFEAKYRYIRFWKHTSEGIKVIGGSGTQITI